MGERGTKEEEEEEVYYTYLAFALGPPYSPHQLEVT